MISTSSSKLIRPFTKEIQRPQKLFVVEGEKMVMELLDNVNRDAHRVQEIFATGEWIEVNMAPCLTAGIRDYGSLSQRDWKRVSNLVTPQPVLALVSIPETSPGVRRDFPLRSVLAFEAIRDPGNLGTIIRTADWFGIRIILSATPDSVDLFNPKVVQATMGSMLRVKVHYTESETLCCRIRLEGKTGYGTFLKGENIYETNLEDESSDPVWE